MKKIGMVLVSFEKKKGLYKERISIKIVHTGMTQSNIRWSSGKPVEDREEGL